MKPLLTDFKNLYIVLLSCLFYDQSHNLFGKSLLLNDLIDGQRPICVGRNLKTLMVELSL